MRCARRVLSELIRRCACAGARHHVLTGDAFGGPIFRDVLTFSGCSQPPEVVDVPPGPAPFVRYVHAVCCESLREWAALREGVLSGLEVVCRTCTLVAPEGAAECVGCGAALVGDAVEPLTAVVDAHVAQQQAVFGDVGLDALETLAAAPDTVLELLVPGSLTALLARAALKRGAPSDGAPAQTATLLGAAHRYLLALSECVRVVTAAAAGAKASAATAIIGHQAQALCGASWAFWAAWGDVSLDVPCTSGASCCSVYAVAAKDWVTVLSCVWGVCTVHCGRSGRAGSSTHCGVAWRRVWGRRASPCAASAGCVCARGVPVRDRQGGARHRGLFWGGGDCPGRQQGDRPAHGDRH